MSDVLYYTTHACAVGTLFLVASHRGLRHVALLENADAAKPYMAEKFGAKAASMVELDGFFTSTKTELDAYLNTGALLKLPIDLAGGTPLQRIVWLEIARIPYGETMTYSTLAERVGFPRAVRAVASACGANPLPLAIPCHRVIAKDGSLGGFSLGGLAVKEGLLARERSSTTAAAA